MITIEDLKLNGFEWDFLPSGRINLYNNDRFVINGIETICATKGKWTRTLEVTSIERMLATIKTLEIKSS